MTDDAGKTAMNKLYLKLNTTCIIVMGDESATASKDRDIEREREWLGTKDQGQQTDEMRLW